MRLVRAIGFGLLLWVFIFFEVSILMFGLNIKDGSEYYIVHYGFLAILTVIIVVLYYNDKSIKPKLKDGLLVGIVFVITGLVLDAITTVPLFVKNYGYFLNLGLLVGLAEVIIITGIVSKIQE